MTEREFVDMVANLIAPGDQREEETEDGGVEETEYTGSLDPDAEALYILIAIARRITDPEGKIWTT